MKATRCLPALLFLCAFMVLAPELYASTERLVVVLHSYHQGFKWTDDIARGISQVLSQSTLNVEFVHEYLDVKRRWDDEYKKRLSSVLQYKYKDKRVDAVILSDNIAFELMRDIGDELFPGTPVFFCGVNYLEPSQIVDYPNFTGISEVVDVSANLDLITKLLPQIKKVVFVVDATETGQIIAAHLEQQRKRLQGKLEIEQLTDLTFNELEERLRNLSDDTVVLWSVFLETEKVFSSNSTMAFSVLSRPAECLSLSFGTSVLVMAQLVVT